MFVVKQQSIIWSKSQLLITEITTHECATFDAAETQVYLTYAEIMEMHAHYAVISENGKFIRSIKWGELDGFRKPGSIR